MDALKAKLTDFFSKEFAENVDIYPLIESAQGVVELQEIFYDNQGQIQAIIVSSAIQNKFGIQECVKKCFFIQNLVALIKLSFVQFAAEDYCADMGIERGNNLDNMIYARSRIATIARAEGVGAIDAVCAHDTPILLKSL